MEGATAVHGRSHFPDQLRSLEEGRVSSGIEELGEALGAVLGSDLADGRELRPQRIKSGVYRLLVDVGGVSRAWIAKRLDPDIAHRNMMVVDRWLPALGLAGWGPVLVSVAAERSGACVWHLYEDLGLRTLEDMQEEEENVSAAVTAIAGIHRAFADHPLLGECRLWGGDLGPHFFLSSVRDALRALDGLRPPRVTLTQERAALRDRLRQILEGLAEEDIDRSGRVRSLAGPETLLHGDLWPKNVIVSSALEGREVRLIDWDHAAVGHVTYDLSTFLMRFPSSLRTHVLHLYRTEMAKAGWTLPDAAELNELFDTAERGRIANRVIWPALAALDGGAEWAFEALAEIESWFDDLAPVLEV